ncbi:NapC/NirT family cytochrome c [uncultured Cohaesibacter sp.]|uniref:NapC/NirT family cytochrome c n=1 Tax=uncultured Cohaesibacter sp. TaxID=1002546 RepID=UPI002930DB53|nr:NapC/NirT family cytochrome c [uncultured Cohaesibacter sp.]
MSKTHSNLGQKFRKLFLQPAPIAWSVIAGLFFIIGIIFWGGFHSVMKFTDSVEFCTSCHSMQTPFEEYKKSAHYENVSGVRALCSDCHVPKDMAPYVVTKIKALKDVWGEVTGVIDSEEKFESHRLAMAQTVWAEMEKNNSATCRECHSYDSMNVSRQAADAKKQHPRAIEKGDTCISCHKGLVHKMPDMGSLAKIAYDSFKETIGQVSIEQKVAHSLTTQSYFLDQAGQEKGGKVLPGAPMTVLAVSDGMVQIELNGWRQEGVERVLYVDAGKRILIASLGTEAQEAAVAYDEPMTIEETGQVWQKTKLTGWIPQDNLTGATDKLWHYADALYNANCAQCHAAPHLNEFDSNQWSGQFKAMEASCNMTKEEARLVQTYLQMHASDMEQSGVAH